MKPSEVRQLRIDLPPNEGQTTGPWLLVDWDMGARWHPTWLALFGLVANLVPEQDDTMRSSSGNRMATAVLTVEVAAKLLELLRQIPEEHQTVTSRSAIRRLGKSWRR